MTQQRGVPHKFNEEICSFRGCPAKQLSKALCPQPEVFASIGLCLLGDFFALSGVFFVEDSKTDFIDAAAFMMAHLKTLRQQPIETGSLKPVKDFIAGIAVGAVMEINAGREAYVIGLHFPKKIKDILYR